MPGSNFHKKLVTQKWFSFILKREKAATYLEWKEPAPYTPPRVEIFIWWVATILFARSCALDTKECLKQMNDI